MRLKKEAVMTEPEVEETSSFDEVQAEVVMPKQEPYVEPKVACPDCGVGRKCLQRP